MAEMRAANLGVSQSLRADWRDALDQELTALERDARNQIAFYSFDRHHGAEKAWQLARVLKQRARRVALGPTARGGF